MTNTNKKATDKSRKKRTTINLGVLRDSIARNRRTDVVCELCIEMLIIKYGLEIPAEPHYTDDQFLELLHDGYTNEEYADVYKVIAGIQDIQEMTHDDFQDVIFARKPYQLIQRLKAWEKQNNEQGKDNPQQCNSP